MTVKELLQKEPFKGAPVGIYTLHNCFNSMVKPIRLFFGEIREAIESRYADCVVEDYEYSYSTIADACGYIIYIKEEEVDSL